MTPETLFAICNNGVLPAWLLLIVAPGWAWTDRIVHALWIPVLLGLAYGIAMVQGLGSAPEGGSFTSLAGVMALFTQPWAVCGGWIHYLAFDLFVGAWEARDSQREGIAHLWVIPCLILTLMLGPLGLLLYLAIRTALRQKTTLQELPA